MTPITRPAACRSWQRYHVTSTRQGLPTGPEGPRQQHQTAGAVLLRGQATA